MKLEKRNNRLIFVTYDYRKHHERVWKPRMNFKSHNPNWAKKIWANYGNTRLYCISNMRYTINNIWWENYFARYYSLDKKGRFLFRQVQKPQMRGKLFSEDFSLYRLLWTVCYTLSNTISKWHLSKTNRKCTYTLILINFYEN